MKIARRNAQVSIDVFADIIIIHNSEGGGCRSKIVMKLSNLFKSPREAYCAMTTVNEYGPHTTPDLENSDSVQQVTPSLPSSGIITREDFASS